MRRSAAVSRLLAAYGEALGPQGDAVASVLSFFSLPFVQANPSRLWNRQRTLYGSAANLFPERQQLTMVMLTSLS